MASVWLATQRLDHGLPQREASVALARGDIWKL